MDQQNTHIVSKAQVELAGKKYTLKGDLNPDYMHNLARYVDKRLQEIKEFAPSADVTQTALLVALNLADEVFQMKEKLENSIDKETFSELEEKTRYMIRILEKGIIGE